MRRVRVASLVHVFCFFFQAEDGIRDYKVTGVQTCALPIYLAGLYVILVAVTALLMPPANAGLVTLFAGLVYFADVFWGHSATFTAGGWVPLAPFFPLAGVTAHLGGPGDVVGAARAAPPAGGRPGQLRAGGGIRNPP